MKRIYAVTMENGDVYGIPAEVIAENYAAYYASLGEDYKENYDTMLKWFDTNDFEFEDWAKNNMNWEDVADQAVRLPSRKKEVDFQEGWMNGEVEYLQQEG